MEPDDPVSFGYKCAWLAIRSDDAEAVATALSLKQRRKSGWAKGIDAAYQGEIFVTPPIKGWIFAVSISLPEMAEKTREDRLSPLLLALGEKFPDVQYFGTHRVVEYHGWARVVNGKIIRRYGFVRDRGEVLCDKGKPTEEERKLGLQIGERRFPREQDVMSLAGAWSVDPTTLEDLKLGKRTGYLGMAPWQQAAPQ